MTIRTRNRNATRSSHAATRLSHLIAARSSSLSKNADINASIITVTFRSDMTEENLQTDLAMTAEINLYYDLFVPLNLAKPAPLLIAVHGYGAHKRYMMREARLVAPDNFVIASIQAPHPHYRKTDDGFRVGFGWLSDHKPEEYVRLHHKFVLDVIAKLVGEGMVDETRVIIYGFSQACALNFRFAFTHPDVLAAVIGICGGIPGDLETNEIYKPFHAKTLYLYGDDDEFYTQDQFAGFNSKLENALPDFQSKHYTAKHEITDEMRKDIKDFLTQLNSKHLISSKASSRGRS